MTLSQLQHVVESSALSQGDKDLWLHILEALDDDAAATILDSLSADGEPEHELEEMTRSIKRKQEAFANGDVMAFSQIVDEEVRQIRDL